VSAGDYARQPSRKELAAVRLLALPLAEASVKIRTGPPSDGDSPDAALSLWAGELPLATTWQQPIPDPALPPGIRVPARIRARAGTRADQSLPGAAGSLALTLRPSSWTGPGPPPLGSGSATWPGTCGNWPGTGRFDRVVN